MVDRFTAGMNLQSFREDPKTVAAVERKLQIVSEAAIRLGSEAENRIPGVAWRNIRGIGNWLRHQYPGPGKTRSHECERCTHECVRHDSIRVRICEMAC
jgi:uncharacterized protein with HEPN domain